MELLALLLTYEVGMVHLHLQPRFVRTGSVVYLQHKEAVHVFGASGVMQRLYACKA